MLSTDIRTQVTFLERVGVLVSDRQIRGNETVGQQTLAASKHRTSSTKDLGDSKSDCTRGSSKRPSASSEGAQLGNWDKTVPAPPEVIVMQYLGDIFTKGTDRMQKMMEKAIEHGKPEHQVRLIAECRAHQRKIEAYISRLEDEMRQTQ